MTSPEDVVVSGDLPVVLAAAMHHALRELGQSELKPSSTTVAIMAEYMIAQGWPASLPSTVPTREEVVDAVLTAMHNPWWAGEVAQDGVNEYRIADAMIGRGWLPVRDDEEAGR